jgi:hypothetical protein
LTDAQKGRHRKVIPLHPVRERVNYSTANNNT